MKAISPHVFLQQLFLRRHGEIFNTVSVNVEHVNAARWIWQQNILKNYFNVWFEQLNVLQKLRNIFENFV